jgi:hypothetical protein
MYRDTMITVCIDCRLDTVMIYSTVPASIGLASTTGRLQETAGRAAAALSLRQLADWLGCRSLAHQIDVSPLVSDA